ncbi:MAG: hypothetical protein ABL994_20610, partial [Verrucomicrobiales bacterium]
ARMIELNSAYRDALRRDQGFSSYYLERLPCILKEELRTSFGDLASPGGSESFIEPRHAGSTGSRRFPENRNGSRETTSIS